MNLLYTAGLISLLFAAYRYYEDRIIPFNLRYMQLLKETGVVFAVSCVVLYFMGGELSMPFAMAVTQLAPASTKGESKAEKVDTRGEMPDVETNDTHPVKMEVTDIPADQPQPQSTDVPTKEKKHRRRHRSRDRSTSGLQVAGGFESDF